MTTATPRAAATSGGTRPAPGRRAPRVSSMQLKLGMAVSGAILFAYLVVHMIGNLKIFWGAESLDVYAAWLREIGAPALPYGTVVWITRIVLLAAVIGHIVAATILARRASRARPVRYAHARKVPGSYATRTMRWGGVIIALFVVYHLLDLTTGTVNPNGVYGEVYANVTASFAPDRWYVTAFYTLAVVAVGLHLRHGLWSALQTFGRTSRTNQVMVQTVATGVAAVLTVGFLAVPFAVVLGLV